MPYKSSVFYFILFVGVNLAWSQTLSGTLKDRNTNAPIVGASVYFDNTSYGTTTNFDGEFYFELKKHISAPLVISFVGYESIILYAIDFDKVYHLSLKQDVNALEEVVLDSKDEWSRPFKLQQFRREFLGHSKFGMGCAILNEDAIVLNFDRKTKQLVASSKAPLVIKNIALEYLVRYDLNHFSITYNIDTDSTLDLENAFKTVHSVGYYGTTFFENISSNNHRKALRNRKEAYIGSTLHFMRAVANNRLKEEKFKIFKGAYQIKPETQITTFKNDSTKIVEVEIPLKLNILCKGKQSAIQSEVKRFQIDAFGNHAPVDKVLFGGFMGHQRIGDALPLDYGLAQ
ncbi:carboxypeptidase-like regulatory domain-containing protein [Lacinutrix neustonica]|uniref:Carboxypeptidase-like regulatory domain-containing protein n=1 Tax=Lacinutrix neustonica TaxID=2980107 RepID=A0A9E8SD32_9FLAO|nr:carboxypeptidase-like regulatory domain-containing protein [Lacinutrix neustonica]WAC00814.1 carboxypeptidase-like regulatory domain-containing protein [Lacinutrix neustonica]